MREFFIYTSEIMENEKDVEVLKTNLKPSFWRTLKTILRQNKKVVLLQFLFGPQKLDSFTDAGMRKEFESLKEKMEKKIQIIYDQVNSLQDRISDLETKLTFEENSKSANEVLHLVNFDKIRNSLEKPSLVSAVLNGAEDAGCGDNIAFINFE